MTKLSVRQTLSRAKSFARKGEIDKARALYQSIIDSYPSNISAKRELEKLSQAHSQVKGGATLSNMPADQVLSLETEADARKTRDFTSALVKNVPTSLVAWSLLGDASRKLGLLDEAEGAYRMAIELDPSSAELHNKLGVALREQGKIEEGVHCYQKALSLDSRNAEAYVNLGVVFRSLGRLEEAELFYRKAIEFQPDLSNAFNNLGNVLRLQGRTQEAVVAFEQALQNDPLSTLALNNLGSTYRTQMMFDKAIEAFERSLQLKPDLADTRAELIWTCANICDWDRLKRLLPDVADLGVASDPIQPFMLISNDGSAENQYLRAKNYARSTFKQQTDLRPQWDAGGRIRIGYFGSDFHDHATMHLMSGLLRCHDRSRFEIFVYSYGVHSGGEWHDFIIEHCDHFFDISAQADHVVLELVHSHQIDIAFDLKGYTKDSRIDLFQYGLAPIQISYLGYPGTVAADFMDYVIADEVVISERQRAFFSEKVIYLPNCYQPNDNRRVIAPDTMSRSEAGLPESGFVFCCFNNSYKISSSEFDIWMRLLGDVEGSVLWLLSTNDFAKTNLRAEAKKRNIDPERIVFADWVPQNEHLARFRLADLFVDTFICNAHTTASDALWAGVPVVTMVGDQFPARVAASLLHAVGLEELVTSSQADYEQLIKTLSIEPDRLRALRKQLQEDRMTSPLFDTERYTRNFEEGIAQAYAIYSNGEKRRDIRVIEAER
ncbi:tetratricopeptide repeat protein [Cohaesibacter marisflavi]|uniref:tetratricopeptide repeat protein n=1 Tax=Cohaesibacter marisflavi TaxID=655353 RepID=UPI0029C77884|nr:tetratricopeptide repeat protein [Cohaesibacter marisflavi]